MLMSGVWVVWLYGPAHMNIVAQGEVQIFALRLRRHNPAVLMPGYPLSLLYFARLNCRLSWNCHLGMILRSPW